MAARVPDKEQWKYFSSLRGAEHHQGIGDIPCAQESSNPDRNQNTGASPSLRGDSHLVMCQPVCSVCFLPGEETPLGTHLLLGLVPSPGASPARCPGALFWQPCRVPNAPLCLQGHAGSSPHLSLHPRDHLCLPSTEGRIQGQPKKRSWRPAGAKTQQQWAAGDGSPHTSLCKSPLSTRVPGGCRDVPSCSPTPCTAGNPRGSASSCLLSLLVALRGAQACCCRRVDITTRSARAGSARSPGPPFPSPPPCRLFGGAQQPGTAPGRVL